MKQFFEYLSHQQTHFKVLNPEQQKIAQDKTLNGEFTPEELLKNLKAVEQFKLKAKAKDNVSLYLEEATGVIIFSGLAVFVCVLLIVIFTIGDQNLGTVLFITIPIISISLIISLFYIFYEALFDVLTHSDFEERNLSFILPLFAILKEELKPNTNIKLDLDLINQDSNIHKKTKNKQPLVQLQFPRLSLQARLADGTSFHLKISDNLSRRLRIKKRRYKTKKKTKFKIKTVIVLQLKFPKNRPLPSIQKFVQTKKLKDHYYQKSANTSVETGKKPQTIVLKYELLTVSPYAHIPSFPEPDATTFLDLIVKGMTMISRNKLSDKN